MFGIVVIWIGVFVDKFKEKFKVLPVLVIVVWVGFYSMKTYKTYKDLGLVDGFEIVKLERIEIYDLIDFLSSKKIEVAYSTYNISHKATFLSGGKINVSEYSNYPTAKSQKRRSLGSSNFAVISHKNEVPIYQKFLLQNKIRFNVYELAGHEVYWNFSGDQTKINKLRSLIPYKK